MISKMVQVHPRHFGIRYCMFSYHFSYLSLSPTLMDSNCGLKWSAHSTFICMQSFRSVFVLLFNKRIFILINEMRFYMYLNSMEFQNFSISILSPSFVHRNNFIDRKWLVIELRFRK